MILFYLNVFIVFVNFNVFVEILLYVFNGYLFGRMFELVFGF